VSGSPDRVSSSVEDLTAELVEARRENAVLREALAVSEARVAAQAVRIEELSGLVQTLSAQVAGLSRRLGADSSNSSKPPSSDGPNRPRRVSSTRQKTDRKPGGQQGHPGSGLQMVAKPDRVRRIEPGVCSDTRCGRDLAGRPQVGANVVQVFDLPDVSLTVTQLELVRRRCACGKTTTAPSPVGISGPACYGPNVRSITALISKIGQVSVERTAVLMEMILAAPVSTGFVASVDRRLHDLLASFEQQVKDQLANADVAGADETPVSLAGKKAYVYTFHNGRVVWYGAADNRGHKALDAFGILTRFRGVLVRDDYSGYYKYATSQQGVQLCLAHIIRDLTSVYDTKPERQWWAKDLRTIISDAIDTANTAITAGHSALEPEQVDELRSAFRAAAQAGIRQNLDYHGRDKPPGLILARRLIKKIDQFLYFLTDLRVPPTNNFSERALRRSKTQQKISGCWRSLRGLQAFCRIHSYLTTAANHDVRPIDALRAAFTGQPWTLPATT
jgi:transposase